MRWNRVMWFYACYCGLPLLSLLARQGRATTLETHFFETESEDQDIKYTIDTHETFDQFFASQGLDPVLDETGRKEIIDRLLNVGEHLHMTGTTARTPSGKKDPEKTSEKQISDFRKALEPVGEKESSCFTKTYGYWSYEYCPRRSVRQFHREGKKETVSILLGTYTPSGDRVLVGDTSSPQTSADPPSATSVASTTSNDAKEAPLFEEHYEGGDGSRVAIVQFSCDKNTQGTDRIAEIVENPTHTYTIRFATRAVCPLGQIEDSATSAERLLAPLRTQCLRKVDSWWTYEVCPGKRVQQYHKEKNAPRPTIIHLLGRYNASESLGIEHLESIPNETNRVVQYFVEAYTNGSSCDITKNPRRVNVKYKCAIDEKFSFIESVVEQSTCAYAIVVATPLLCAHPAFEASKREEADGALTVHCIGEGSEMAL